MLTATKTLITDRLGSVRTRRDTSSGTVERSDYFPFGEERTPSPQDRVKFATYHRDPNTGIDYADQRHYTSLYGRFLTPDPYEASGGAGEPGSWNRYAYVEGDPVNRRDPSGLSWVGAGEWVCGTAWNGEFNIVVCGETAEEAYTRRYSGAIRNGGEGARGGRPSDSGQDAWLIASALIRALRALEDPDCAGLFNTDENRPHSYPPGVVLQSMVLGVPLGGTYFGSVKYEKIRLDARAVTKPAVSYGGYFAGSTPYADIVLQTDPLGTHYSSLSPVELALVLLHELGHVYDLVSSLGGSKIKNDVNADGTINWVAQRENEKNLSECRP